MVGSAATAIGLELSPEALEVLKRAARTHGIRLLVAFGSQVSGQTHAASDVDLAVLVENWKAHDPLRLLADLQAAFPREIDLVWLNRADPLIAWAALRRPHLLLGDTRELIRAQTYAWRRFVEYQPFFQLEARAVHQAIARLRDGNR